MQNRREYLTDARVHHLAIYKNKVDVSSHYGLLATRPWQKSFLQSSFRIFRLYKNRTICITGDLTSTLYFQTEANLIYRFISITSVVVNCKCFMSYTHMFFWEENSDFSHLHSSSKNVVSQQQFTRYGVRYGITQFDHFLQSEKYVLPIFVFPHPTSLKSK